MERFNHKKPEHWLRLPLMIGEAVLNELVLEFTLMTQPKPEGKPASIQHVQTDPEDIVA